MNFVSEWTTMSAPCSIGRSRYGVATVLSTMSGSPLSCATPETPATSRTWPRGFEMVSAKKARVLGRTAARHCQRRALEHVGQSAVDDAFLQQVGVHHQVEQRAFQDHVAAPLDEAELGQQAQVHVHARLLAQLVAEVRQQRGVGNADRGVFGARDRRAFDTIATICASTVLPCESTTSGVISPVASWRASS